MKGKREGAEEGHRRQRKEEGKKRRGGRMGEKEQQYNSKRIGVEERKRISYPRRW
jgi:hypothetical protein